MYIPLTFSSFSEFENGSYIISLISHEPLPPTQTVLLVRLVEVSKHWKSMPYFVIFKCLFTWVIAVCHFAAFKFSTGKKVNNFRESLVQRTCFVMLSLRNLKFENLKLTWIKELTLVNWNLLPGLIEPNQKPDKSFRKEIQQWIKICHQRAIILHPKALRPTPGKFDISTHRFSYWYFVRTEQAYPAFVEQLEWWMLLKFYFLIASSNEMETPIFFHLFLMIALNPSVWLRLHKQKK